MKSIRVQISGQVQGVFFRHSAKAQAEKLGLGGWIKNNPDGTVEAVACGEKEKLEEFIAWCKKGPAFAKVENVEVEWKRKPEEFGDFSII